MKQILIVDDDREVQQLIRQYLEREGFYVDCAANAKEGMELLKLKRPNLIVLDVFLPDANGLELCNEIRRITEVPITLISAKGDESDKVLGLGMGADDFITKPFGINELVARIKAQLRRNDFVKHMTEEKSGDNNAIITGPLVINSEARVVYCRENLLTLTAKEFDMLTFFARNENRVFNKDLLYETIWGYEAGGDSRTVTVHIRKLREKIEENPNEPQMLLNVWGVGYKFTTLGVI